MSRAKNSCLPDRCTCHPAAVPLSRRHVLRGGAVLHTSVIMVMGHGNCGAVQAAIAGKAVPGQISGLYSYLRPAVDQAAGNLDAAIRANAKIQARLLAKSSPVLAAAIKQRKL